MDWLINDITELLPIKTELHDSDNLLGLGLTSLKIMKMVNRWRKKGIKISFGKLMQDPTLGAWKKLLEKYADAGVTEKKEEESVFGNIEYNKKFPLTDIQYAYKIGREDGRELGGIGCHAYIEFNSRNIDKDKLDEAWYKVLMHHPMLRVKFTDDGMQEICEQPYNRHITVIDLRNSDNIEEELLAVRERLSHRRFEIELGDVAAVTLCIISDTESRMIFDIDLLSADVMSFSVVLRDLADAYTGKPLPETADQFNFEKYIEIQSGKEEKSREDAYKYWQKRIPDMPLCPELPLKKAPSEVKQTKFTRRIVRLDRNEWDALQELCRKENVTPAAVTLTAFAVCLAKWSRNDKFLINIPYFNRNTEYEGIENAVADFTTLLLLEADLSGRPTFRESLSRIENQLHNDMEHTAYSGVNIQRDITKMLGEQRSIAPVVFACNFGDPLLSENFKNVFGNFTYMISQTPGVWLDFQSYEDEDGLMLTWDTVDELFCDGVVDDMISSLEKLMKSLITDDWNTRFELLPEYQLRFIEEQRNVSENPSPRTLFEKILENADLTPDKTAVIDTGADVTLTYSEIKDKALRIAGYISQHNIRRSPIAISLTRGYKQAITALGILLSDNIYVPVTLNQPAQRRAAIYESIGIKYAITDNENIDSVQWPDGSETFIIEDMLASEPVLKLPDVSAESPAYIIMTSGTTGLPKGAQMCHKGAANTIDDVNEKFDITSDSVILGVSSMDFDLSVYDLFGILSAGGTLVQIPEEKNKDAESWLDTVLTYGINVWNSVPVLLDMLLLTAEEKQTVLPFKTVMLSGDWIGMDLPERVSRCTENCRFISMGGATEASIWSNYQEVTLPMPENWKTIPYGRPLAHQSYRVIDENGEDVPFNVEGELIIGGTGVGTYRGAEELTAQKFFAENGISWYRTGDKGRFWNDGTIEFLGRRDFQVKIRGHRIELGEIESALKKIDGVDHAAVEATDATGDKHLAAFIESSERKAPLYNTDDELLGKIKDIYDGTELADEEKAVEDENIGNAVFAVIREVMENIEKSGTPVTSSYKQVWDMWKKAISNVTDTDNISQLPELKKYLEKISHYLPDIITGKLDAVDVYYKENAGLTPMELYSALPDTAKIIDDTASLAGNLVESGTIIEFETRDIAVTRKLLSAFDGRDVKYIYYDSSAYFVDKLKCLESEFDFFESRLADFDVQDQADAVICFNSLHRAENINTRLEEIRNILKPDGMLMIRELAAKSSLMLISAAVLEKGRDNLLTDEQIMDALENAGFDLVKHKSGQYLALSTDKAYSLNEEYIKDTISDKLPEYMIPQVYYSMKKLPVSRNGKIDRKALKKMTAAKASESGIVIAETETQKALAEIWSELFGRERIGILDNYYQLGGDSLLAVKLLNAVKSRFSVNFTIGDVMENITIQAQAEVIDKRMNESGAVNSPSDSFRIKHDEEHAYEPFPLTDVQRAYWIGRGDGFTLGNVSTHCYFELECEELDLSKAETALNELISAHGMMRVVIDDSGVQRILRDVPYYHIEKADHEGLRETMQSQVIELSEWPLFDIKLSEKCGKQILHISFDNIIFDGWSMFRILTEWNERYKGTFHAKDVEITFRDYVAGLEKIKASEKYEADREYWNSRIDDFANAPEFNLRKQENEITDQKFVRRSHSLNEKQWDGIRRAASNCSVTPSVLLMTAYSDVIRRWSKNKEFTLNLTRFDRKPLHDDINELVGDFTTLYLLEVKNSDEKTFADRARKLQDRLTKDLEHSDYSTIELERSLRVRNRNMNGSIMPVVFTSGLGVDQWNEGKWLGRLTYNVSQTPQVWLDHQVVEQNGGLGLFWDSVDELFYEGVLDDMFESYVTLLEKIADAPESVDTVSFNMADVVINEERKKANMNTVDYTEGTLDGSFLKAAEIFKDKTAVSCCGAELTYNDVRELSLGIAEKLKTSGISNSEPVAIYADKGNEQVIFAMGILMAGGVYVPLDAHNPYERIKKILDNSGIKKLLVSDEFADSDWLKEYEVIRYDGTRCSDNNIIVPHSPDDTAYIIYTSGSTGEPKGVVISHNGALNTIKDVNSRFGVTENDTAFGISNLNFDLSVYDIFGMLTAGGKLCIPDKNKVKEPEYWLDEIEREHITLWNSVPAFANMLISYELVHRKLKNPSINKFFLSGDWIGLTLPDELRSVFSNARVISMGGATEASIWSNFFEVPEVIPSEWKSIPYGKPLANQKYYILDENLEDCPVYVPGDIYIGGKGVAKGYMNDDERTEKSFIIHPVTNEYIYKTGDMGMYWRDGNIEFLGRTDNQIKINGYRVEEGEIETAINKITGVNDNKVIFSNNALTSFIITDIETDEKFKSSITDELKNMLPEYMIPQNFIKIEKYPLTPNGKIDVRELCNIAAENYTDNSDESEKTEPVTDTEKKLAEIWREILGYENVYLSDDFFIKGGDSLKAISIMNKAEKVFGITMKVKNIFSAPVFRNMAELIDSIASHEDTENSVETEEGEL